MRRPPSTSTIPHCRAPRAPALLLAIGAIVLAPISLAQTVFQGLGDLPGDGFESSAIAISGDGSTVVGKTRSDVFLVVEDRTISGPQAYRWTEETGMVGLGQLLTPSLAFSLTSEAGGVNQDGSVVVGISISDTAAAFEAFRWTEAGGMQSIGFLSGTLDSQANAVSDDGSVVVGKSKPDPLIFGNSPGEAFRWTAAGGMVGLGVLPGGTVHNSRAVAVSGDGSVVVGFGLASGFSTLSWVWTAATDLDPDGELPGGFNFSEPRGLSQDGMVAVGFSSSAASFSDSDDCSADTFLNRGPGFTRREAYRKAGPIQGLGDLPGGCFDGIAHDTTADGSIVVGLSNSATSDEACIWDAANGMRGLKAVLEDDYDLDLTGWTLYEARGISDDGTAIAGTGRNPAGDIEGWVVHLPEPDAGESAAMALLALLCLLPSRRRRARS